MIHVFQYFSEHLHIINCGEKHLKKQNSDETSCIGPSSVYNQMRQMNSASIATSEIKSMILFQNTEMYVYSEGIPCGF